MLVQTAEPGRRRATGEAWSARPRLALGVRVITFVAPIAASVAATSVVNRWLPQTTTTVGRILLIVVLGLIATAVLYVADRAARKLLPLAALLKLSLVFPDHAPSRYRTALRTGTVHQLERRVAEIKANGFADDETEAAEQLLELVAALSVHDRITRGHAERVRAYARLIGEELGLPEHDLERLHWSALLHDVGKLFVPGEILNKPGRLTHEEFEVIKQHPGWGAELCEPLRVWLGDWVDAVGQHHEWWDGHGYPNGLVGEDIALAARIVSVADVFDVITSVRSYKRAEGVVEAREELARCAGTQFEPRVVRAFLAVSLGRLRLLMGPLSSLAHLPGVGRIPLGAISAAASGLVTAGALLVGGVLDRPEPVSAPAPVEEPPPTPRPAADPPTDVTLPEVAPAAEPDPAPAVVTLPPPPPDPPPAAPAAEPGPEPEPAPAVPPAVVPPVPLAPVAVDDTATTLEDTGVVVDVLANDTDPDGDTLTITSTSSPDGTATTDGTTVTYSPAPDTNGTHTVTYTIHDGALTATATITITVTPVNDAPTFTAAADVTVDEDAAPTSATWATGVAAGPADEAGQSLIFTATTADPSLFDVLPAVAPDGTLTFTLAANAWGTTTVDVVLADDGGTSDGGVDTSATVTLTITVAAQPDAPVAGDDAYAIPELTPLVVPAPGVLANDGDEDGDSLSTTLALPPASGGVVVLLPDGSFVYTPLLGFTGEDTFTYTVSDGSLTDTGTVTILVSSTSTATTFYLANTGASVEDWALSPSAPSAASADPDADGNPGLTIKHGDMKLTQTDVEDYQHWRYTTPTDLALTGPVTLSLWSTAEDFDGQDDLDYSIWLQDCAADGTGCATVASTGKVHVDEWNGGVSGWVRRDITIGSVTHTVTAGRMLQLRVMFGHHDLWFATDPSMPSTLTIIQPA